MVSSKLALRLIPFPHHDRFLCPGSAVSSNQRAYQKFYVVLSRLDWFDYQAGRTQVSDKASPAVLLRRTPRCSGKGRPWATSPLRVN